MGINGFYKILEVDREASEDELRESHERLVKIWDPDKHPTRKSEAEYKLERISMAYDVLSDPEKRKDYDSFGRGRGLRWRMLVRRVLGLRRMYLRRMLGNWMVVIGVGPERLRNAPTAEYKLACGLEELYKGAQKKMMLNY